MKSLFLIPFLLTGCALPKGQIVSVTQSVIGIKIGQNVATGTPELQIGFFRSTFQIVPTSTNQIYAPMVNSSLSLDQKSFATAIDEEFLTGGATASPDSVAKRGATARGKTPLATKGPLPKSRASYPCTNSVSVPVPSAGQTSAVAVAWAEGFSIVFPAEPSEATITAMRAAKMTPTEDSKVWKLAKFDFTNRAQINALHLAQVERAVLKR